jgi:2-dehydropantoate 2-reductase
MSKIRIGIIGAGPVGSMLSAHLINAAHEVYLVDVLSHLVEAIKEKGLQIVGVKELYARIENAYTSIDQLHGIELDQIYICTKSIDLPGVSKQLQKLKLQEAFYISFQNGIDNEDVLTNYFPCEKVFRGVINYAGMISRPGVVKMTFFHPPNYIGSYASEGVETAKSLAQLHSKIGIETEYSATIKKEAWRKSILNSVLMPVSVTTGLTMAKIMGHPELKAIVEVLLKDFLEVAKMEGFVYEEEFFDNAIAYLSNAGDHKPSMLTDFEMGRPLEIDYLNIKIQEYAEKHNVPCTYNKLLCALIKGLLLRRDAAKGNSRNV